MKTLLAKLIAELTKKLGRKPSFDEVKKVSNGAGLLLLSDKITGPTGFEMDVDHE